MTAYQAQLKQDNRKQITTINPNTGEHYRTYYLHTQHEAEQIVEDAHAAFLEWRKTDMPTRAEVILKLGKLLMANQNELAKMMCDQMGKPLQQGMQEVELCAGICDFTAKQGPDYLRDEKRQFEGGTAIITYQPLGVILGMQPWNFPLYQALRYAVAVILAGNSTVFRHAEICWETAEKLLQLFEQAGLPKNVFSVLYVNHEIVDQLIQHEKVRGVTFTGSAKVGSTIGELAGKALKKSVLELGGSDPYIVLEDANIDLAVDVCAKGRIFNGGQTCTAAKRFVVHEKVYDEFKAKFVEKMKSLQFGDPNNPDNDYGPLASIDIRKTLHEQVTKTEDMGGTILCGGKIPDGKGYFYPPTVIENPPEKSPAFEDELFGPVAVLIKAKDEKAALQIANQHRYGLGGGIISSNIDRATQLARTGIDSGMVNINGYFAAQPNLPFGGIKQSGYGREHGGFGVREFVNVKSVLVAED